MEPETDSLDRELVVFEGPSEPLRPLSPEEQAFYGRVRDKYLKAEWTPSQPEPRRETTNPEH